MRAVAIEHIRLIRDDDLKARFYVENYDVVFSEYLSPTSDKRTLGTDKTCRFCGRTRPDVTFNKIAHAIPEALGNTVLFTCYECDACNDYFSEFEGELSKAAGIFLLSAQIKGKRGVPSLKTRRKQSRVDMGEKGIVVTEYEGDPIFQVDDSSHLFRVRIQHQRYRPLGAYRALVKVAMTLLPDSELEPFRETLSWLQAKEARAIIEPAPCLRTFVPGPRPIPVPHAIVLRRKPGKMTPYCMLFLATGNTGFQVVVPCREGDQHLGPVSFPPVPMTTSVNLDLVKGPPVHYIENWSSPNLMDAPGEMTFHFDSIEERSPQKQQTETGPDLSD